MSATKDDAPKEVGAALNGVGPLPAEIKTAEQLADYQEGLFVLANASNVVANVGEALTAAGFSPPVLWYVLSCAARAAELGLVDVAEKEPSVLPLLEAARVRVPQLLALVDVAAAKGKQAR